MFSDKLTKAIAEAAKTVMAKTNETYPDAASTSIYADKAGDAPISDVEASMDRKMTDEDAEDLEAEDLESLQGLLNNPDEESAKLNYGSVEAYKKMIQSD